MSDVYLPIHPMIPQIDTVLPFDLFRRDGNEDYTVLYSSGEHYSHDIHGVIFKDSLALIYIRAIDLQKFYSYIETHRASIVSNGIIEIQHRAQLLHELLTHLALISLKNPTKEHISRYKNVINSLVDFVSTEEAAIKHLIPLAKTSYNEFNHLVNVGIYGIGLAKELFGNKKHHNLYEIAAGFFLHDIGKSRIPQEIAEKRGPLDENEWCIMRTHASEGYNILHELGLLSDEIGIILLQHHERHDGSGYPSGLSGDQIHMYSKICSIADAFDALTAQRPYRDSISSFKALGIMREEMKHEFDPDFFSKFVFLFRKNA